MGEYAEQQHVWKDFMDVFGHTDDFQNGRQKVIRRNDQTSPTNPSLALSARNVVYDHKLINI
jgi:hypothetical protein